ncbi:MAG TPA: hypothetical protein VJP76_07570, partial [Candidatus Tumulicola sp.]|nr:hypothetical protein [Candidatus Tumulicola sp.]
MALLIVRAKTIVTCDTQATQAGIDFEALGRIDDAAVLIDGDRIVAAGPRADVEAALGSREAR